MGQLISHHSGHEFDGCGSIIPGEYHFIQHILIGETHRGIDTIIQDRIFYASPRIKSTDGEKMFDSIDLSDPH